LDNPRETLRRYVNGLKKAHARRKERTRPQIKTGVF
jgi:hypothetical protein